MIDFITLIERYIHDKHLGYSGIDRDFLSLQETENELLKNPNISLKKGKGVQLKRENQSPEIIILLDLNINLKLHLQKNIGNNPITAIRDHFKSDYLISIITYNKNITEEWMEYCSLYDINTYETHVDPFITEARKYLEMGKIPVIVSDFLDYGGNIRDLAVIQICLPDYSNHFHSYYLTEKRTLQSEYMSYRK